MTKRWKQKTMMNKKSVLKEKEGQIKMVAKSNVILGVFVVLVMFYFMYMLQTIFRKQRAHEAFEENAKEAEHADEKPAKKDETNDQQLDKNLFIINTFEEVHDKKISTLELKELSKLLEGEASKQVMKEKIEAYKKEKFEEEDDDELNELLEMSSRINNLVEKLKSKKSQGIPTVKKAVVESFTGIMPFNNEKKYMSVM